MTHTPYGAERLLLPLAESPAPSDTLEGLVAFRGLCASLLLDNRHLLVPETSSEHHSETLTGSIRCADGSIMTVIAASTVPAGLDTPDNLHAPVTGGDSFHLIFEAMPSISAPPNTKKLTLYYGQDTDESTGAVFAQRHLEVRTANPTTNHRHTLRIVSDGETPPAPREPDIVTTQAVGNAEVKRISDLLDQIQFGFNL